MNKRGNKKQRTRSRSRNRLTEVRRLKQKKADAEVRARRQGRMKGYALVACGRLAGGLEWPCRALSPIVCEHAAATEGKKKRGKEGEEK